MSPVLSARAAAARRGVSDRTIRRWIASGRLKADKVAGEFLIDLEELDALTGHAAAAAAAPRRGPDSTAASDTGGSRLGAAPAAAPSVDVSGLIAVIERQQAQLLERTEAAAMWQTRALMLEERLALTAPQAPVDAPTATPAVEPATDTSKGSRRPWGRRWLGKLAAVLVVAVVVALQLLLAWLPR